LRRRIGGCHQVASGHPRKLVVSDAGQSAATRERNSGSTARRNDAWRNGTETRNSNNNNNRETILRRSGNDVWRNSLERRNNAANSEPLWRNGGSGGGRTATEQMTKEGASQLPDKK
jgi:hypothetical protein